MHHRVLLFNLYSIKRFKFQLMHFVLVQSGECLKTTIEESTSEALEILLKDIFQSKIIHSEQLSKQLTHRSSYC